MIQMGRTGHCSCPLFSIAIRHTAADGNKATTTFTYPEKPAVMRFYELSNEQTVVRW